MKALIFICKLFIYLVGAFFVVMSFDCFPEDGTMLNNIGCFIINSIPGVVIIGATILLRKKELILGILLLVAAIFFFFFFKFYIDIGEKLLVISVVILPLLFSGIVFTISRNKYNK
jgi:hypothetical protein